MKFTGIAGKVRMGVFLIILVALTMFATQFSMNTAKAVAVNGENIQFTYIDSSDTQATSTDSIHIITGIDSGDEIRFALKMLMSGSPGDSVEAIIPYTDSLTIGAGYVTPNTFTYGDDYFIIWREMN